MPEAPTDVKRPPSFEAPPQESRVLFGRFGLRAGFGVLIFLVIAAVLVALSGFLGLGASGQLKHVMLAHEQAKTHPGTKLTEHLQMTATYVTVADGVQFAGLLGLCWLLSRGERRRFGQYGLGASRVRDVAPGAAWGILSMSVLVWFLKERGLIVFDGRNLHGAAVLGYGLFWLLAFTLVGFCEEYLFRGYLLYTITRGFWGLAERISPARPQAVAFWIASFVMSAVFAAMHMNNAGENAFGIFEVFFIGMAFCYSVWRTGSLWWGIGYHALWDFMQSFTFGVADSGTVSVGRLFVTHAHGARLLSGGADGPEGSLYSVVAAVLTFVAVRLTTRPGVYPPPEQMAREPHSGTPESTVPIPYNQLNA
jgi:membrane protease YdiL (CAAX protease family)